MAKKTVKDRAWQEKFSFALAIVVLLLVFGYFIQVFLEIREQRPVLIAIERMQGGKAGDDSEPVKEKQ